MRRDLTWLVALGASLWGTSALLREPLSRGLDAPTVVFFEHLALVLFVSPFLPAALRAWASSSARTRAATVIIGAGSSALATTLFTAAFQFGDPITPQVLQKLQPLLAILLAVVILGERLRPKFAFFAIPALIGAWLLTFAEPFNVGISDAQAALFALGAAALWAAGTVLGRLVDQELGARNTLVLRFAFGLPATLLIVLVTGSGWTMPISLAPTLIGLALIPGLLALTFYYIGLRRTPASRATFAELFFPVTAAIVGVTLLDASMTPSRWMGMFIVVASVTALAWHEQKSDKPAVIAPKAPTELSNA